MKTKLTHLLLLNEEYQCLKTFFLGGNETLRCFIYKKSTDQRLCWGSDDPDDAKSWLEEINNYAMSFDVDTIDDLLKEIAQDPDNFVEITPMDPPHISDFVKTDWTDDPKLKEQAMKASDACDWTNAPDEAIGAYSDLRFAWEDKIERARLLDKRLRRLGFRLTVD